MLLSADLKHICQNLNQFGYGKGTKHGGLSDYTIIPARYAYLLKTDLEDRKAAILERMLLDENHCHLKLFSYSVQHVVWLIKLWRVLNHVGRIY